MANKQAVGERGAPFTVDVERGKILEFARATHSANPGYVADERPVAPRALRSTIRDADC